MLGCICIIKESEGRTSAPIKSIDITGLQTGVINTYTVKQVFKNEGSEVVEAKYVMPNDGKLCQYDMKFLIGDEVIKPIVEKKKEAEEVYLEAKESGNASILSVQLPDGLTEFHIGNIPSDTEVEVNYKVSFVSTTSGDRRYITKFPLSVCSPRGSESCLTDSLTGTFSFHQKISQHQRIERVYSNIAGRYEPEDEEHGQFSLESSNSVSNQSIVLTTEFQEPVTTHCYESGRYMCANVIPTLPSEFKSNKEFIFVVDCSGSMSGSRIKKARECLDLFIRSLPQGCFFNIIRFGTHYENLFDDSSLYDEEHVCKALNLSEVLQANLGGTNIFDPLSSIFSKPVQHETQRQIFVLTDGEVSNRDEVIELVSTHRQYNRVFSIGVGSGADAGLVEGLARESNGHSDFVTDQDDLSDKVIPQLEASLVPSFEHPSVSVEGIDSIEVSPYPLPPFVPGSINTFFVKKNEEIASGHLLISGDYCGTVEDIVCSVESHDIEIRDFEILYNFEQMKSIESCLRRNKSESSSTRESMINQITDLSISSGILCSYTSFVGVSNKKYREKFEEVNFLSNMCCCATPMMELCADVPLCCGAAPPPQKKSSRKESAVLITSPEDQAEAPFSFGSWLFGRKKASAKQAEAKPEAAPSFVTGCNSRPSFEAAPPPKADRTNGEEKKESKLTLNAITKLQNFNGYWEDAQSLFSISGEIIEVPESISRISESERSRVFATIVALRLLHHHFTDKEHVWKLIENKSLDWLRSIDSSIKWESLILNL